MMFKFLILIILSGFTHLYSAQFGGVLTWEAPWEATDSFIEAQIPNDRFSRAFKRNGKKFRLTYKLHVSPEFAQAELYARIRSSAIRVEDLISEQSNADVHLHNGGTGQHFAIENFEGYIFGLGISISESLEIVDEAVAAIKRAKKQPKNTFKINQHPSVEYVIYPFIGEKTKGMVVEMVKKGIELPEELLVLQTRMKIEFNDEGKFFIPWSEGSPHEVFDIVQYTESGWSFGLWVDDKVIKGYNSMFKMLQTEIE